VFKLEAEDLKRFMEGEAVEAKGADGAGVRWTLGLRRKDDGLVVEAEEAPFWSILIGGHVIGHANHEVPAEAMREAFAEAGLSSLPEAVEVVVRRHDDGESWVIFTLEGDAYCVPHAQFVAEVAGSDRWISAQQTKRQEIDALMAEVKAAVGG
jgi:hypothetical protein